MTSYFTSFFYWWSPIEEDPNTKKEPVIIQAAARNMPNGMLDPSKLSKEEAKTKCLLQKKCIPICVTRKDLEMIKLRKTVTQPTRIKFFSTNPLCQEIELRNYKKNTQKNLIEELQKYFKEHPIVVA